MAEFKQGTEEEVKSGAAQFKAGAIVSDQARTNVSTGGGAKTPIYHRVVVYPTQDEQGKVSGADRLIYIEKNGTWQPAAISKDGGKTYQFSDPNYPTMAGVAGAGLQNDLKNTSSDIYKNLDANTNLAITKAGIPQTQKKSVVDSIKNNSDQEEQTGDGSQLGPAGPPETGQNASGTKTSGFGDFKYPLDIATTKQDVIKFTMLEYKPSGVGASFGSVAGGSRGSLANGIPKDRKIAGTVVLPVPSGISDTNSADWGSNTMNALEAALAAGAYTGITEGLGKGVESVGSSLKTALADDTTGRAIGAAFAGAAVNGDGAKILQRAEGAVINPNMELLFNGPQLRPFTFTFKMSARNQSEAQEIIKILNFFKRGMSPIKTESNLFLKAPNTFKIQYLHLGSNGKDHPYIGRIKECALQNVTVNYTPEGQYATFRDGVMVSYEMQMQFQELEPVFNSDYEGLNGIGY